MHAPGSECRQVCSTGFGLCVLAQAKVRATACRAPGHTAGDKPVLGLLAYTTRYGGALGARAAILAWLPRAGIRPVSALDSTTAACNGPLSVELVGHRYPSDCRASAFCRRI